MGQALTGGLSGSTVETLFRLLPGPQPALLRFGGTVLIVSAAFALRLSIGEGTGRFGFIHFILPVVAASLLFGRDAGFFAVALSAGAVASVVPWTANFEANVSAIVVFVIVASCLVFVAHGLRSALSQAHAAQRAADLLLQEMSHRVKNKFAMISSIIALQARSAAPDVRAALEDVSSRVQVIATVHNYLQLSRHDGLIDMSEYIPGLCQALQEALCGPRPIAMKTEAEPIQLPAEKALTTGLIINELVTNAFKYAFPQDEPGHVKVELTSSNADLIISVADDGVGCPKSKKAGLGTRLVTVFAGQLGGTAEWDGLSGGGCKVSIRFPR
jgi:two-component sensor histidine kinase